MAYVNKEETYSHQHHSSSSSSQRPASAQSGHSSHSSGSSAKHVKCIGSYVLLGTTLGKGNFARVESAIHTLTRSKVAIKIIETDKIKEEYVKKNLLREAQLMRRLRHPNIIRLYETMKTNNLYCLVTEIAEGGELLSFVRNDFKERRLPEATTRPFVRQLTSALYYLHGNGIVHRDLKMENILLDKKKRHVKIVDFGLSNAQKPGALLQTHCGSPEYAAPELFIPGRQYGPEVDVWSLGVNMYAMLVGKLPFRSPRQGNRKRQKLLEQISAGITEGHEKEMLHLSTGAQDLIGQLLQPDSSRRIMLDEVMHHLWVTKDNTQSLKPYEHPTHDPLLQVMVMELMQKALNEPMGQIRETVRRDRCDWLAAIYNLLMDHPEGRTILQRLTSGNPIDNISSAAEEFHTTAEHLSLSQNLSQSQHSQDQTEQSDLTGILTKPSKHESTRSNRHINPILSTMDGDIYNERGEYNSATLPLTKSDKKRHDDYHRGHNTLHPSSAINNGQHYRTHRYSSVDFNPRHPRNLHFSSSDNNRKPKAQQLIDDPSYHTSYGQLTSVLPTRDTSLSRPHSRLSAPEPMSLPFQKSFYHKMPHHQTTNHSHDSPLVLSPSGTPPPMIHDSTQFDDSILNKRRPGSIKHRKPLPGSIDTQIDGAIHGSVPWKGKVQVGPYRRSSVDSTPHIGWSSQTQFSANRGARTPADIQSLMPQNQDVPHKLVDTSNIVLRSSNSTEIKPELFSNTPNNEQYGRITPKGYTVAEKLQFDILPMPDSHHSLSMKNPFRSSSAKHPHHSILVTNPHIPEMSTSAKHFGDLEPLVPINGLQSSLHNQRELPHIDNPPNNVKDSPSSWTRKNISGIIGKAFKRNGGGNIIERNNLIETPDIITDEH